LAEHVITANDMQIGLACVSHGDDLYKSGVAPAEWYDSRDWESPDDLAERFKTALTKLEGLIYAVCGAIPASYEDALQWWHNDNPRCLWPDQRFYRPEQHDPPAIDLHERFYYLETGQDGTILHRDGTGLSIGDTGYFDWSRSGTQRQQWIVSGPHSSWFPFGSIVRTPAGTCDDPEPDEDVTITWTVPTAKSLITVTSATLTYYDGSSPPGQLAMVKVDNTWSATIPGAANETVIRWFISIVVDLVTICDPHGETEEDEPSLVLPADEDPDSWPGNRLLAKAAGTSYYYEHFAHSGQVYAFPELLWEYFDIPELRKSTGTWQFRPWTTIRPGLINLCRWLCDWFGDHFSHDPDVRKYKRTCCDNAPIRFRWTGANVPHHYREGGKAGVFPVHDQEDDAGDAIARRTWRGQEVPFDYSPNFAAGERSMRYANDESWRAPATESEWTAINSDSDLDFPGGFFHGGYKRGLRTGDRIDRVHLEEIISAVDYLCTNGVWAKREIVTCKRTPEGDYGFGGGGPLACGWDNDWELDGETWDDLGSLYLCERDCRPTSETPNCDDGGCVEEGDPPVQSPGIPWAEPESIEECLAQGEHEQQCVDDGVCTIKTTYDKQCWHDPEGIGDGGSMASDVVCGEQPLDPCGAEAQYSCGEQGGGMEPYTNSCHATAAVYGYSAYICGVAHHIEYVGEGTYESGRPVWSDEDDMHGNNWSKSRPAKDGNANVPQNIKSMGNRAGTAKACDTRGSEATAAVEFDSVSEMEWGGLVPEWVDNDWFSCEPDVPVEGHQVPYPDGSDGFFVDADGVKQEMCELTPGDWGDTEICVIDADWCDCTGDFVWVDVDLNLDEDGVPQLYDYELDILRLEDEEGSPEYDPPIYPDTPTEEPGKDWATWGDVQCTVEAGAV
jgi:hypothetical protein